MIAVPLFVGAILLASTMLGTGVWLGARDYGRPDDGPDNSDLALTAHRPGSLTFNIACVDDGARHAIVAAGKSARASRFAAGVIAAEETAVQ